MPDIIVNHQRLGIFLEKCRDRHQWNTLIHRIEGLKGIAHDEIHCTTHQQLHVIDLGPAHPDGDIETVFLVDPQSLGGV